MRTALQSPIIDTDGFFNVVSFDGIRARFAQTAPGKLAVVQVWIAGQTVTDPATRRYATERANAHIQALLDSMAEPQPATRFELAG